MHFPWAVRPPTPTAREEASGEPGPVTPCSEGKGEGTPTSLPPHSGHGHTSSSAEGSRRKDGSSWDLLGQEAGKQQQEEQQPFLQLHGRPRKSSEQKKTSAITAKINTSLSRRTEKEKEKRRHLGSTEEAFKVICRSVCVSFVRAGLTASPGEREILGLCSPRTVTAQPAFARLHEEEHAVCRLTQLPE